jgi:hypothetical protein
VHFGIESKSFGKKEAKVVGVNKGVRACAASCLVFRTGEDPQA